MVEVLGCASYAIKLLVIRGGSKEMQPEHIQLYIDPDGYEMAFVKYHSELPGKRDRYAAWPHHH